jgi:hypothetical protein
MNTNGGVLYMTKLSSLIEGVFEPFSELGVKNAGNLINIVCNGQQLQIQDPKGLQRARTFLTELLEVLMPYKTNPKELDELLENIKNWIDAIDLYIKRYSLD